MKWNQFFKKARIGTSACATLPIPAVILVDSVRKFFLLAACFLVFAGCNSDTATQPDNQNNQNFTLAISGNLTATGRFTSPDEVAVLFDGREIARKTCGVDFPFGCYQNNIPLDLAATTNSTRGSHTLDFQLLSQTCDLLSCNASEGYRFSAGNVTVSNSSGVVQQISLAAQTLQLNDGDKVTYQINVNP
jgi:hypothetical protein